jgi:lipoprotein-anchoring transpeptidase ErfK/SrfK
MTRPAECSRRTFAAMVLGSTAAACAPQLPAPLPVAVTRDWVDGYGPMFDAGYRLPGIPEVYLQGVNRRMTGAYLGEAGPNTLDVDPYAKFLYHVKDDGTATRYPVGVGRAGRSIRGRAVLQFKRAWPSWTPTANMLRTEPEVYGDFRAGVPGGLRSPLGARALYLFRNGRDTFYRIHGTNDLGSIGNSGSAGCIRLFNQDIIHLYNAVSAPMSVLIRSPEESQRVDPENFGRGIELPPVIIAAEDLLGNPDSPSARPPDLDALAGG